MKDLKEYLRPPCFFLYCSAGILLLGILVAIGAKEVLIFVVFGVIAVLNSITTIASLSEFNNTIRQYTENGTIDQIVEEFQRAEACADGRLRMGSAHIFGNHSGTILDYKDITRVYQYVHKTNYAEDRRELRVYTKDNKTVSLCKLSLHGKSDDSLQRVILIMLAHNPAIKIGYL